MHVIVQSKTLPITDSLRQFVEKQAEKLERLGVRITRARVHLENIAKKSNDPKSAIVQYAVSIPGFKEVVVKRTAVDMYDAIVDVTQRACRYVRRAKERRIARVRRRE